MNKDELVKENQKLKQMLRSAFPEKSNDIFICGRSDADGLDGLPHKIMVCPAYGSDVVGIYTRDTWPE